MAKTGNKVEGRWGKTKEILVAGSALAILGFGLIVLLEKGELTLSQTLLESAAIFGVGVAAWLKLKGWWEEISRTNSETNKKS